MDTVIMLKLMHEVEQLRRHEDWTRTELESYQQESLHHLRESAYTRSPFYQTFHKGLQGRPLSELPVLTKAMLMENFDDLVTDRAIHLDAVREYVRNFNEGRRYLNRYCVNTTSGSAGEPGVFLYDREAWTMAVASFARAHEWAGVQISLTHRMKMASIASTTPWHMSAQVGATLKSWWMPALRLAATDPLRTIVEKLNIWQPEMLVAYASMARILADEQLAGRLNIRPHLIFTSSEVLTDETRRRVTEAWGHAPFNQYAATEMGGIAAETKEHRGMFLFEDLNIVEVVDENYRPVPAGTFGAKLLVTNLFNRTQPLIRYEISDSVCLGSDVGPDRGPFRRIASVQGRTEDVLRLPSASNGEIAVHPLTFHRLLDALPVSGWQVAQQANGLNILLSDATTELNDEALREALADALVQQGVDEPQITIKQLVEIPKSASGKTPLIKANRPIEALGGRRSTVTQEHSPNTRLRQRGVGF